MSCKQLLGLTNCKITEEEIIEKLQDAKKKREQTITFKDNEGKTIEINIKQTQYFECGIMDGCA